MLFAAIQESLSELCAWMAWCDPGYSLQDCQDFISGCQEDWENRTAYAFAIVDGGDGALLGTVSLNQIDADHGIANLGYWIRSARAGQGIGTTAVGLAARFALYGAGLARLEIIVPFANHPSNRLAQKLGARLEGVLRKRILLHGERHDALLYSLLPEDCLPASDWRQFVYQPIPAARVPAGAAVLAGTEAGFASVPEAR
jgi:ribosomal-protein-serine acetyltransferase